MATITSSAATVGAPAKGYQTGVQCGKVLFAGGTSGAAGDVILGCKIPNGATVIDLVARVGHKADTQATLHIFVAKDGDGSATAIVDMGTQVLSATGGSVLFRPTTASLFAPTKISLSDDAAVQYALLKVSIQAGTTTSSFSVNGFVMYTMDEA
jgi:hypothetical protein